MVKGSKSKMPEVTCLGIHCNKVIEFPSYIRPQNYDGQVRCQECKSLMHIKLVNSDVLKYSLVLDNSEDAKGHEILRKLKEVRGRI